MTNNLSTQALTKNVGNCRLALTYGCGKKRLKTEGYSDQYLINACRPARYVAQRRRRTPYPQVRSQRLWVVRRSPSGKTVEGNAKQGAALLNSCLKLYLPHSDRESEAL